MQFEAYIKEPALRQFETLAAKAAEKKLETMALLIGTVYTFNSKTWTQVDEIITSQTKASAVSVQFSHDDFTELIRQYKEKAGENNKLIIGWIHSHPTYGCFLSSTDLRTQKSFFNREFNIAVVVDPMKSENGKMLKRTFKLTSDGITYREASFAVIK